VKPGLSAKGIKIANMPFSVGRLPLGNEPLPRRSIDLKIPDARPFRLSREHFAFYRRPQGVCVVDLGSTLGTQVNGEFLGHDFSKDFVYLRRGENKIFAGGSDSPFTFRAVVKKA
jgi:pSer/pThr/pTyr-binding forkhead associated (FHA) protein